MHEQQHSMRRVALAVVAAAVLGALSASTALSQERSGVRARSDAFWDILNFAGEVRIFGSVDEMARDAHAVVVGTYDGVESVEVVGYRNETEHPDSALLTFAYLRFDVSEVLDGSIDGWSGPILVREFVPVPSKLDALKANIPTEPTVLYLYSSRRLAIERGLSEEEAATKAGNFARTSPQSTFRSMQGVAETVVNWSLDEDDDLLRGEPLSFGDLLATVRTEGS